MPGVEDFCGLLDMSRFHFIRETYLIPRDFLLRLSDFISFIVMIIFIIMWNLQL